MTELLIIALSLGGLLGLALASTTAPRLGFSAYAEEPRGHSTLRRRRRHIRRRS